MSTEKKLCELKLHHKRDFKAKHRCSDCNKFLCAGCAILHRNNRQSRSHTIEDIKPEEYSRERFNASPRISIDSNPRISFDGSPRVSFAEISRVNFYDGNDSPRASNEKGNIQSLGPSTESAFIIDGYESPRKSIAEINHDKMTKDIKKINKSFHTKNEDSGGRTHIKYRKHIERDVNEKTQDVSVTSNEGNGRSPRNRERKHRVQESEKSPNGKSKVTFDDNITDLDFNAFDEDKLQTCPRHDDKLVEYYCGDHNILACGKCAIMKHRQCDKLVTIETKSKYFEKEDYVPKLSRKIDNMSKHVAEIRYKDDKSIEALKESYENIPKGFGKLKQRLLNMLEMVEQKLNNNAEVIFDGLQTGIQIHQDDCDKLQQHIAQTQRALDKVISPTNGINKFVVCHKIDRMLEKFEKYLFEIHKDATAPKLTFKIGVDIDQMMHDFTTSLEIGVRQPKPKLSVFPLSKHMSERNAVFVKRFSAKTMSDGSCPRLCGSTFLPNGKIAFVDQVNKKLKIFHKNYVLLAEKEFDTPPWNVIVVNDTCVAVSLYEEKSVQILRFGGFTLSIVRTIASRSEPYALSLLPDMGILATFDINEKTASIGIVTNEESKRYLKKFPAKTTRNVTFKGSLGLAYNDLQSAYYVSSYTDDRVTGINSTGTIAFIYEHTDLIRPFGIALDGDGNIYVCSKDNSKIHQVLPNGNLNKCILTEIDGIKEPLDISFNDDGDVFLVTCEKSDIVRIYKME